MKSRNYRQQNKITTPKTSTMKLGTSNKISYDVATEAKEDKNTIFLEQNISFEKKRRQIRTEDLCRPRRIRYLQTETQ